MKEHTVSKANRAFLAKQQGLIIDGKNVQARSGETFDDIDPATGDILTTVASGGEADVDAAVAAARRAFENPSWRRMPPAARSKLMVRLADLIEDNADELAILESLDNGKPVRLARAVEVQGSINAFRYFAGWPTKLTGETIPAAGRGGARVLNYTVHDPVGVVGQIIPWNFPLSQASGKVAPALAAGCTVVLKPAEQTPLTALRLGELALEAGFPEGVLNVVTGFGEAGAALAAHDGVDKVRFTGSTEVGRAIVRASAGNLKRVSLELGGKSPNIVLPDANLETVAAEVADAIFFNQGQVCTAGSRLYVHRDCYDQVIDGVVEIARRMKIGPGLNPDSQLGPLVSHEQRERVHAYVDGGRDDGAEVVVGGGTPPGFDKGFFYEPTVLTHTDHSMRVVNEEIFGPVVCAMPWDDVDDLVRKANDTIYGLAAGIWTSDLKKAHLIADGLRAGTVWINCYNFLDPASPFGGYKQSGWGREKGRHGVEQYTELKSVWVNLG